MYETLNPSLLPEPRITREKIIEDIGIRHLEVDITPGRLRNLLDNRKSLTVSVVEVLPMKKGRVVTEDLPGIPTVLLNSEMHKREPAPAQVSLDFESLFSLSHAKEDRLGKTVFVRGLSFAIATLQGALFENNGDYTASGKRLVEQGEKIDFLKDISLDPNRFFIRPFDTPKDILEELAQNYLRFVLQRYASHDLTVIDLHADPMEQDSTLRPHIILGRTNPANMDTICASARRLFPNTTVLWDVDEETYRRSRLDLSFADALLPYTFSCTLECSGGLGNDKRDRYTIELELVESFKVKGIIAERQASEWQNMIKIELETMMAGESLLSANHLFLSDLGSDVQLRRKDTTYRIERELFPAGAVFEPDANALAGLLNKGERIGMVQSSRYDFARGEYFNQPICAEESCVVLGFPAQELSFPGTNFAGSKDDIIVITTAVREK